MPDGRRRLRAHWPPRRKQRVSVELGEEQYAELYHSAEREGWSLEDEVRAIIEDHFNGKSDAFVPVPPSQRVAEDEPF